MEPIRINKYLSEAGVCSRREADRLIEEGRVTVDGLKAETGMKVTPASRILVDGKKIGKKPDPVLIAVNKPVGVVTTTAEDDPANIVTYVGWPERIYPIGRLDKDSEGLILMTNQGELAERIGHARGLHEKEYLVSVDKAVTKEFVEKMASGVRILKTTTRPCTVEKVSKFRFRIVLTQGLNRQIRRMCEALGYQVTELVRVRVMNISLNGLELGHWRRIEGAEYDELLRQLGMK
ncbi:MAG: pseudouridine synthase [Lachnospiraceae bacterium]|nr:pseudouridine synthase [Lachnospiraceae bacterium]